MPAIEKDQRENQTNRIPGGYWSIGKVIISSFDHSGSVDIQSSFVLCDFAGSKISFPLHLPDGVEYRCTFGDGLTRDENEIAVG